MKNKAPMFAAVFVVFLMLLGQCAKSVKADEAYYEERITYIMAYDKPFPEHSVYKCKSGKLYKNRYIIKSYTGKAVPCSFKLMTRKEYEDFDNISRLF